MLKIRTAQPGFSLTEIIIAIMIIGTMMGATLGLFSWLSRAKVDTTAALIRTLKSNIDLYYMDTGVYPTTLEDLWVKPANVKGWKGYLEEPITVDKFGNEFQYSVKPKGSKPPYELYSYGTQGEGAPEEKWIKAEDL